MGVSRVRAQNMTLSFENGKQTLCLVALAVWDLVLSQLTVSVCVCERSLLGRVRVRGNSVYCILPHDKCAIEVR